MSNYTQAISFGAKDVLTSTDPAKIILGANVDSELALIATAITSKLNTSDLAGNYTISGNITFTGTNVIPAAGLTGTVIDARLSANVPLLNVANNFTALQAITVADATYGLSVRGASGRVLLRPYVDATNGAVLESTNAAESLNLPLSILATTLRLSGSTSITLNGVNATDFARLSQSNTFTAVQTIDSGAGAGGLNLKTTAGAYINLYKGAAAFGAIGSSEALGGAAGGVAIYLGGAIAHQFTTSNATTTLNGVAVSDFARLSLSNTFASSNIRDSASPSLFDRWRLSGVDKAYVGVGGGSAIAGLTSSDFGFTSIGGGSAYIGTNGTARLVLDSAGTLAGSTIIGVAFSDFARLSQSNTFTGATQTINAASALLKVTDGTREVRLNAEATKGSIGTFSNHPFAIFTNNSTVLSLDAAGTLAGSTIAGVAFSDFARLSQAVAFAATVTAATGLTVSANGATITGNSTITGTLGGLTGLTVASGGVNITGTVTTPNTSANEVGYKGLPQNSQAVSYTTVLADCNKNLHQTGATKTFTIDSNANVAAPIGTVLNFTCDNATGVSIAITTDTLRLAGTATTGTRTLAQYGVATAIKILSTTWLISGAGLS